MAAFYQALLESSASEHAARMLAMKNASDSARDMMESLTFTYNQVRQAGITQEIAEISSGAAALA
jgi:F-type H+-transporting ATPase subunit gamma